jgi:uncharacterized membrane protein YcaP (DUF421 family)
MRHRLTRFAQFIATRQVDVDRLADIDRPVLERNGPCSYVVEQLEANGLLP